MRVTHHLPQRQQREDVPQGPVLAAGACWGLLCPERGLARAPGGVWPVPREASSLKPCGAGERSEPLRPNVEWEMSQFSTAWKLRPPGGPWKARRTRQVYAISRGPSGHRWVRGGREEAQAGRQHERVGLPHPSSTGWG